MDDVDRILRVRVTADGLPLSPRKNPWRCRAVSGLALVTAYGTGGSVDFPAGWSPLDDIALQSCLLIPGGYAVTGTVGVDLAGVWADQSGNGRDFLAANTPAAVPSQHADGYPVFDGGASGGLTLSGVSFNGGLAAADNGAIVVIAKTGAVLDVSVSDYQNTTLVSGSGATPHMVVDDTSGLRVGGYDTITYVDDATPGVVAATAYVFAMKWDGVGVYNSLAGAAWSAGTPYNAPQVSLDGANMGADIYIGNGYGGAYIWPDGIMAVAVYPNAADVDDAKLAQWQAWAVAQGLV